MAPFKVICIDASDRKEPYDYSSDFRLIENDIYSVIDADTLQSVFCYALLEDDCSNFQFHASDRFIPLSEIDETNFVRQTNTQTV